MRAASTNGWPCSRPMPGTGCRRSPSQASPRDTISLIYDDRRLLETRVRRLASPRIYSQEPRSRTSRMIGNVTIEEAAPDGTACTVRSKCQVLEYRRETQRHLRRHVLSSPGPGWQRHPNCLEARGPRQLRRPARRIARAVLMSVAKMHCRVNVRSAELRSGPGSTDRSGINKKRKPNNVSPGGRYRRDLHRSGDPGRGRRPHPHLEGAVHAARSVRGRARRDPPGGRRATSSASISPQRDAAHSQHDGRIQHHPAGRRRAHRASW